MKPVNTPPIMTHADTDELYSAHVHTVTLGMGFGPDLTSTATARSSSDGRFNGHGA